MLHKLEPPEIDDTSAENHPSTARTLPGSIKKVGRNGERSQGDATLPTEDETPARKS
jgi:hypothetical protein